MTIELKCHRISVVCAVRGSSIQIDVVSVKRNEKKKNQNKKEEEKELIKTHRIDSGMLAQLPLYQFLSSNEMERRKEVTFRISILNSY